MRKIRENQREWLRSLKPLSLEFHGRLTAAVLVPDKSVLREYEDEEHIVLLRASVQALIGVLGGELKLPYLPTVGWNTLEEAREWGVAVLSLAASYVSRLAAHLEKGDKEMAVQARQTSMFLLDDVAVLQRLPRLLAKVRAGTGNTTTKPQSAVV